MILLAMKCPQCGFDHEGWGFVPGYPKLCVRCRTPFPEVEGPEEFEESNLPEFGFFRRGWARLRGRKKAEWREEVAGDPPWPVHVNEPSTMIPGLPPVVCAETLESNPHELLGCVGETDLAGASNDSEESIERFPGSGETERRDAGTWRRQVRLLAEDGRYEEAIALLEKAVEIAPNDAESWGELGRVHYLGTRDFAKSIECCQKALAIDSTLVPVHCTLCLAFLQDSQFDGAKKGFLRAIRLIQNSRHSREGYQENRRVLLQDCLQDLYKARKEASGRLLGQITSSIELLELEKTCFH